MYPGAQWFNGRALGYGAEGWWFKSQSGPLTGKLSLFTQQLNMGTWIYFREGKVAKGEEMGAAFHMPCPLKQWFSTCYKTMDPLPHLSLTCICDHAHMRENLSSQE